MDTKPTNPYHIARRVGQQGARHPVSNEASGEKCATGRKPVKLRNLLKLGTWNARKMKQPGKLKTVCNEMERYDTQILGISETNWNGQGSFQTEDKLVLFSGKEEGYSHGVACILDQQTSRALIGYSPINDRIMKADVVRLQAKPHNISILHCYAPTSAADDAEMTDFYNALQEAIDTIPNRDVRVMMGDMNAKVGANVGADATCGQYGLGEQNERGEELVEFCRANNLAIMNTMFKHHPRYLYTWTSPDRETSNQIDCIMFNQKWRSCVKNVRSRPGADCNSDHQLLAADFQIRLKKIERPPPPLRLDYQSIDDDYKVMVSNRFSALLMCEDEKSVNDLWTEGKEILLDTAKKTIPKKKQKNVPWITEETLKEIEERRELKARGLETPVEQVNYRNQNAKVQRMMRRDKEAHVKKQCGDIEVNSATNSTKELYQGVRNLTNKFRPSNDSIKSEDGKVLCDREDIKLRWKEYCAKLYAKDPNTPPNPVNWELEELEPPPLLEEVREAMRELKTGKSTA